MSRRHAASLTLVLGATAAGLVALAPSAWAANDCHAVKTGSSTGNAYCNVGPGEVRAKFLCADNLRGSTSYAYGDWVPAGGARSYVTCPRSGGVQFTVVTPGFQVR